MSVENPQSFFKKRSRRAGEYLHAIRSAHHKASSQLDTSRPLLEHLNEFRNRLFSAFVAVLVSTGVSLLFSKQIIDFLAKPIGGSEELVSIEITENISVFMRVSLLSGVTLAMPVIVYQLMRFIMPGLTRREKTWLFLGVPLATLLFLAGVAFTWFVMLPQAIPFLTGFLGIQTNVRPANYFEFTTRILFWMGICFEMPLLFMFLSKFRLISGRQLAGAWRYAIVGMAVLAAVITPTVDPINMGLVIAPLLVLYLVSIALALIAERE